MYKVSLSIVLFTLTVYCSPSTLRHTIYGPIEGVKRISVLGQKYYAFEGIPYAEAPITGTDPYTGEQVDRRFKAPEMLKRKWTQPLKAHQFGNVCMPGEVLPTKMFTNELKDYPRSLKLNVSEDCLFLQVYVPANGAKRKTVLVNLHGGGLGGGVALNWRLQPDFLLSQDNIVVKIGYRVEKYGFLNLGYGEYTGNMALKDQQMALKWIHENIEYFSGKKDEVLLLGGSTGGQYAHFHMLNEQSRKYHKRVFSGSGNAFSTYALCQANHVDLMQECFKIYEMDRLVDALKMASQAELVNCTTPSWYPTIENPNTEGAFLTKSPEEIFNSDNPPVMDAVFAFASQEILQAFPEMVYDTEPRIGDDWNRTNFEFRHEGFSKEKNPKEYKIILDKLRKAYYTNSTAAVYKINIDVMGDLYMVDSVIKTTILQTIANNKGMNKSQHRNTFLYRYSFHSELNALRTRHEYKNLSYEGATHSDDLCYYFYCDWLSWEWNSNRYPKHLESKDMVYDQIMRLVKIITNFARTGDPSIHGDTPFIPCTSSDEIYCQELSNERKMRTTYDIKKQTHYDLWREIDEIIEMKNKTTGNKSNRLIHEYHLISTLFVIHIFLYIFY